MLPSAYLCLNSEFCQGVFLLWGRHTAAKGHVCLFWDECRKETREDTAKSGDSRTMSGRAQGSKFEGGLKCQLHTQESGEFFLFADPYC